MTNTDYIVESRLENGSFERINLTKYMDYRRCRNFEIKNKDTVKHSIVGQSFFILNKEKSVTFTSVVINWHAGYYYCGTYVDNNGSHGVINFENINSIDSDILKGVDEFKSEFIPLML